MIRLEYDLIYLSLAKNLNCLHCTSKRLSTHSIKFCIQNTIYFIWYNDPYSIPYPSVGRCHYILLLTFDAITYVWLLEAFIPQTFILLLHSPNLRYKILFFSCCVESLGFHFFFFLGFWSVNLCMHVPIRMAILIFILLNVLNSLDSFIGMWNKQYNQIRKNGFFVWNVYSNIRCWYWFHWHVVSNG